MSVMVICIVTPLLQILGRSGAAQAIRQTRLICHDDSEPSLARNSWIDSIGQSLVASSGHCGTRVLHETASHD